MISTVCLLTLFITAKRSKSESFLFSLGRSGRRSLALERNIACDMSFNMTFV